MDHENTKGIIKKVGMEEGPTLAIFCGVHGNEKAGIYAVEKIVQEIRIQKGEVYFVFANPKAIEKNIRYVEKNLNRCFLPNQNGNTHEEQRATILMNILDKCEALLDIHASNSKKTTPFVITDNGFEITKHMSFEIVATGFDEIEPGATDGYMKSRGKIGICLECGYSGEGEKNSSLAYKSILQFLQYFNVIEETVDKDNISQRILHVDEVQKVTSKDFDVVREFADFETLPKGTLLAKEKDKQFITDKERVILFGRPGKPVGAEAYILGSWITK